MKANTKLLLGLVAAAALMIGEVTHVVASPKEEAQAAEQDLAVSVKTQVRTYLEVTDDYLDLPSAAIDTDGIYTKIAEGLDIVVSITDIIKDLTSKSNSIQGIIDRLTELNTRFNGNSMQFALNKIQIERDKLRTLAAGIKIWESHREEMMTQLQKIYEHLLVLLYAHGEDMDTTTKLRGEQRKVINQYLKFAEELSKENDQKQ